MLQKGLAAANGTRRDKEDRLQLAATSSSERATHMQQLLDKNRRVHRATLREMCSLMDSPHVEDEDGGRRIAHPASLSPSMASMDTCNKILSLMRTLLRLFISIYSDNMCID